ncbi:MAG TPA: hypothetical protein VKH81_12760 [Candidatus Angelobacter sp.]|nr:hypothetical protein [Candidatus Angelobacter sp.]
MDRNYRYKYEHVQKRLGPFPFTLADINSGPVDLNPGSYTVLLAGVFAVFAASHKLPPIPHSWFRQIRRRCVMVEDLGPLPELIQSLGGKYQYLISTYDCAALTMLCRGLPSIRKIYVIPHYVNTHIYRERGLSKVYDVLFYGNDDARTYPFRARLRKLLEASQLKVRIIEHPDYAEFDAERCGEALARIINQSWLAIATPSAHDYLVAKYFEISAAGAVVAGKMATQGLSIWKENYLRLEEDMSDQEILGRLSAALQDKELLRRQSSAMQELVCREYSLDRYVDRLMAVMCDVAADPISSVAQRGQAG